jgi:FkbM family methyltransferase
MANKYWKKMEKSDGFRRLKLFLKRLDGKEPWLRPDVTVNLRSFDCWTLCPDLLGPDQIVYSLGVGDTIEFDIELIEALGVKVHAFDPTPHSLQWIEKQQTPEKFRFHPWAAAGKDGQLFLYPRIKADGSQSKVMYTIVEEKSADAGACDDDAVEVPALTIATMMQKLGHESIGLLKVDIEGAEYGLLENLLASAIRPDQILVEFHHRFSGLETQQTLDAIEALQGAAYGLAHISVTGREFCFVKLSALV